MSLFLPITLQAQTNYEDVVYLKNGSIIHGIIIEQVPNQSVKIQTRDGNVFFYKIDEIEKMTKEEHLLQKNEKPAHSEENIDIKKSKFTNITEINFGFFKTNNIDNNSNTLSYLTYFYGIQTVKGYLFNPYFSSGIGVGLDHYSDSMGTANFVPLFIDFRLNLPKEHFTPFLSGDFGYSLNLNPSRSGYFQSANFPFKEEKGGLLINPAIGVKFFITHKVALNFSIGYKVQQWEQIYFFYTNPLYSYDMSHSYNKINYQYFNFKIGCTF